MIVSYKNGPRLEDVLEHGSSYGKLGSQFEVFSALYGDGKSRYSDVTKTVQEWAKGEWPDNWEEVLYATRKPRVIAAGVDSSNQSDEIVREKFLAGLIIYKARYGLSDGQFIDVRERLQSLVQNDSLDILVNNSTLTPDQNPYRGKKKTLTIEYAIDGGDMVFRTVEEKDRLIIGPVGERGHVHDFRQIEGQSSLECECGAVPQYDQSQQLPETWKKKANERWNAVEVGIKEVIESPEIRYEVHDDEPQPPKYKYIDAKSGAYVPVKVTPMTNPPRTAPALNDYLIRRFSISPQRLRGPMPIELRDFHRNDLAQLFAELGFKRGAEIGVAEGNYSEILLKANPECELLLVDPWHAYSGNPQNKSEEKHTYAWTETLRKTKPYKNVLIMQDYSMNAVREIKDDSLDFCYIDAMHSYPYVMCDIIEWTKKVRSGGIVALDDIYKLNEKWGAGPMEAIYDYTRAMRINPWWLIAAHKSVDAFFVKP